MTNLPDWAVDDSAIAHPLRLLRRIPPFQVNAGVIDTSTFLEKEDGRGLSVTVWRAPSDLDDIRRLEPTMGVVCVPAQLLRTMGVQIVPVPLVGNLNHCEIFPRLTQSQRRALKAEAAWVHYPEWVAEAHRGQVEPF